MNTLSILILILALIILLPKVKFAQRHTYFEHPYPLEITKAMQGFFAFLISSAIFASITLAGLSRMR